MSRARDLLQIAVLKTNPVFPFFWLNRAPYWVALDRFQRLCRGFPEIRGVYLRHGMTQSGWVPGISDIDLTVTYTCERSAEEQFRFLSEFSSKTATLRRIFPMLADVEIFEADHLPAATRFGIRAIDTQRWKVLLGASPVPGRNEADSSRDGQNKIDDAIYRFFDFLLVWYSEPASYLNRQRMRRVASRILRHVPAELRHAVNLRQADDPALLIARVLLALDGWISTEESHGEVEDDRQEESILTWHGVRLVVLGSRLGEESVRRSLLRHRDGIGGMRLRVVTRRVLRYWLRVWQPRQYYDWTDYAQLVSGPDVLAQVPPPDEDAFVRGLLNKTNLVLSFPQFETVVLQKDAAWFAGEGFRWMVIRGWYLRLYLETGIHPPSHEQTMLDVRRHYPEAFQELGEIRKIALAGDSSLPQLRFRGFQLLKETADAVNHSLSGALAAGVWQHARGAGA